MSAAFLVWGYTYGGLWVEEEGSLENAVAHAKSQEDAGDASFSHIEEVGVGDVPSEQVQAIWDRLSREWHAELDSEPRATHVIDLRVFGGSDWAPLRHIYDGNPDALALAETERFGADRIRVRKIKS